jgi:Protein-L-isoaspartate(D-aspartate) O-methyltransferase (PCMT)
VEWLVAHGFLKSERLKQALPRIPREDFIPRRYQDYAYLEVPMPLPGKRASISCPHSYPLSSEPLELDEGYRFLEVGLGSGCRICPASQLWGRRHIRRSGACNIGPDSVHRRPTCADRGRYPLDTGLTLGFLLERLRARQPASLRLCVLLNKRIRRVSEITPTTRVSMCRTALSWAMASTMPSAIATCRPSIPSPLPHQMPDRIPQTIEPCR